MTDHHPEMTPLLEAAAEIRADLHQAMIEIEDAIAGAAAGRFVDWTNDVLKALTHLHYAFHDHIQQAEGPEGLYHEIQDREPRLRDMVKRIQAEHPQILEAIHEPYHTLRDRKEDEFVPADEVRDTITSVLGKITRHRQKGADLVYEAYYVDLGGMD